MRALILVLFLTACGHQDLFRATIVKVPVSTPCVVDIPAEPDWSTGHLASGAGLLDKVKAVLADRELNKGYDAQLRAALSACVQK